MRPPPTAQTALTGTAGCGISQDRPSRMRSTTAAFVASALTANARLGSPLGRPAACREVSRDQGVAEIIVYLPLCALNVLNWAQAQQMGGKFVVCCECWAAPLHGRLSAPLVRMDAATQ